jgi:hypothetical protein
MFTRSRVFGVERLVMTRSSSWKHIDKMCTVFVRSWNLMLNIQTNGYQ